MQGRAPSDSRPDLKPLCPGFATTFLVDSRLLPASNPKTKTLYFLRSGSPGLWR